MYSLCSIIVQYCQNYKAPVTYSCETVRPDTLAQSTMLQIANTGVTALNPSLATYLVEIDYRMHSTAIPS